MLKIETFVVNMIQENCYIVSDETHETVIIDCGAFYDNDKERIKAYIEKNKLVPVHSIFTHGHFDHIIGSKFLFDTYGIKPEISAKDTDLYYDCEKQLNDFVGLNINLQLPNINKIIDDKYKIKFGTHTLSVISTPGHTPGGVSVYCKEENVLFSGDSLFYCSVGRTDLPGGDGNVLIEMLKQNILTLPEETTVFPGHGCATSIGFEKENNPYITTL